MPRIEVDAGVSVNYIDVGSGDPVVLVPGWSHSCDAWDAQIRELAASNRVVALDPRGQGRSDAPFGDYSIDRHAADLVAVLDALEIANAVLVGWSMGGLTVFRVAALHPERVTKLVLVGSNGVGVVATEAFPHGLPAEAMGQFTAGELTARARYRRQSIEAAMVAPEPDTVQWLLNDSLRTPSWAGIGSLRGLIEANQTDHISAVSMPVLMLHGAADQLFPIDGARWVAARLLDARLVEIPDCGHFPHVEAQEPFNAALLEFVAGSKA